MIRSGPGIRNPLHPVISVLLSVLIVAFGLFMDDVVQAGVFVVCLLILFIAAGYARAAWRVFRFALPVAVMIALLAYLIGRSVPSSLRTVIHIVLLASASVLVITIHPTRMSRALTQLGCPRIISLALLVTVRFIPVLKSEMDRIREAMISRGVRFRWTNLNHAYRAFIIPLMVRLINISDTLAISLETRGFALGEQGTVYKPVPWQPRDALVSVYFVATIVSILVLG